MHSRQIFAAVLLCGVSTFDLKGQAVRDTTDAFALARALGLPTEIARRVMEQNSELLAQRAAVAAAEARVGTVGLAPPAALGVETEEVPRGFDIAGANTRLTVEREFTGGARRAAARQSASADMASARALLAATGSELIAQAARTFAAVSGWRLIDARLVAEDSLLSSAGASLQVRFAAGQARYVDVLRVRTERLRVESAIATARAEASVARVTLNLLMGSSTTSGGDTANPPAATDEWSDSLPPAPDVASILKQLPAISLADAAVASAEARRDLILAAQRPRVGAFVGGQRFTSDDAGSTVGPVLGASVTLPFTAARANRNERAAADLALAAARAGRAAVVAAARGDIIVGTARYEAARLRLQTYSAALLRGARSEREAALASYRGGELSLLELLDFERALAQAETERVRARIEAIDALAALLAPDVSGRRETRLLGTTPGGADVP